MDPPFKFETMQRPPTRNPGKNHSVAMNKLCASLETAGVWTEPEQASVLVEAKSRKRKRDDAIERQSWIDRAAAIIALEKSIKKKKEREQNAQD